MKCNYVKWDCRTPDWCCVLNDIKNFDNELDLYKGLSMIDTFPEDVCFPMDPDFPKDIKLGDNIGNIDGMAVISKGLMEFIKSKGSESVEFLPVSILNHKGRIASKEYYIIHPLIVQDCIDLEKTKVVWSSMSPKTITSFDSELILDTERMDENLLFFRMKHEPISIMTRKDLSEEIINKGFTGLLFRETNEIRA